jgi:hypothetical protein
MLLDPRNRGSTGSVAAQRQNNIDKDGCAPSTGPGP